MLRYAMDPRHPIHRADRITLIGDAVDKVTRLELADTSSRIPVAQRAALVVQGRARLAALRVEQDRADALDLASDWRAHLLAKRKEEREAGGGSNALDAGGGGGGGGGGLAGSAARDANGGGDDDEEEEGGGVFFAVGPLLEWLEKRKPLPKVLRKPDKAPASAEEGPSDGSAAAAAAAAAAEDPAAAAGSAERNDALLQDESTDDEDEDEDDRDPDAIYSEGLGLLLSCVPLAAKVLRLPGSWLELQQYDAEWRDPDSRSRSSSSGDSPRFTKQAWDEMSKDAREEAVQAKWDEMKAARRADGVRAAWDAVDVALRSAPLRTFKAQQRADVRGLRQLAILESEGLAVKVHSKSSSPPQPPAGEDKAMAVAEEEEEEVVEEEEEEEEGMQRYELLAAATATMGMRAREDAAEDPDEDESKHPAHRKQPHPPQREQPPRLALGAEQVMGQLMRRARAEAEKRHASHAHLQDSEGNGAALTSGAGLGLELQSHVDGSFNGKPLQSLNGLARVRGACSDAEFFRHFVFIMQTAGEEMVKISSKRLRGKDVERLFRLDDSASRLVWESDKLQSTNCIFLCEAERVEKVGEWPGTGQSERSRAIIALRCGKAVLLRVRPTNAVAGQVMLWGLSRLVQEQHEQARLLMGSSGSDDDDDDAADDDDDAAVVATAARLRVSVCALRPDGETAAGTAVAMQLTHTAAGERNHSALWLPGDRPGVLGDAADILDEPSPLAATGSGLQ